MNLKKLFSYSALLMSTVSSAFAQCVVGGTNFDTGIQLCNPQLTNDEDGWFSKDLADLLEEETKNLDSYTDQSELRYIGLTSDKLEIPGDMITAEAWEENSATQMGRGKGYSAIVANPKLISPLLSEAGAGNMLVNFGTSHDSYYVMSYSVSELKPNSNVTLTCDVYNLLDRKSLAASAEASGVSQIKVCGIVYEAKQDVIYGTPVSITYSTGLDALDRMDANRKVSPAIGFGEKISLTITAKADQYGKASFYFGRMGGTNTIPIGIDNIKIVGDIQPTIYANDEICFGSNITLRLKHNFPAGTKYDWSELSKGSFSTSEVAFYEASIADKVYTFECTVTLPDGCAATTESKKIVTKTCCEDGNVTPVPLPYTNIYYEDFGRFEGNTYIYTDLKGNEVSVKATDRLGANEIHYSIGDLKTGGEAFPELTYNREIYNEPGEHFAISDQSPYTHNIGDNTTRGNGGAFMMVDLQHSGYLNKSIFEKKIEGLCPNKDMFFDAYFVGISEICSRQDGLTAKLQAQLIDDNTGDILMSKDIDIDCSGLWSNHGGPYRFMTSSDGSVTMKIISLDDDYLNPSVGNGDFGIDDIRIAVCATPDISLDYDLAGPSDLLNLCTDDILTLKTLMSSSALAYYGTPYFLFQYSYDDPLTMDPEDVTWVNLGEPQQKETFTIINPADHPAFSKIKDGDKDKVYFRTVVGNLDVLNDAGNLFVDAYTPCRSVSVSAFPVVAGLNCAVCTTPDPVEFSVVGGKFNAANKTVEIKIDETAELGMANAVHGIDNEGIDYFDYVVEWFKEDVKSDALVSKECTSADNVAPSIIVDYADVENAGATGVKYIIYLHDNFDPVLQTPCDITDTITVIAKDPTSLDNYSANTILITPNPASTKISVVAEGVVEKVEILNVVGEVVKVSNSKEINIANLYNGVYFVRIIVDGETTVHKLVINK